MIKKLLLSLILLQICFQVNASHAVGGNFVITQTGANTFTIKLRYYRDCNSASTITTPVAVGIYIKTTNAQQQVVNMNNPVVSIINLGDNCYTPAGVCVEEQVFTANNIFIPNNPNGYYLQTQLYARNNIILNLNAPGSTGMSIYAEIPDPAIAGMNSSPDFGPYPTNGYFCANNEKNLDFSITDADGDSLVYSLVEPLNSTANGTAPAPYTTVNWQAPYSFTNIVGGNPPMVCDPVTGVVTASPTAIGTFVFALKVEEYRNGIKIGEVRGDIQILSLNCSFDDFPEILPNDVEISVVGDGCFDIVMLDPDQVDSVAIIVSSPTFDDQTAYLTLPPIYQTTPDTTYLFSYTDALGNPNSVVLPEAIYENSVYSGIGGVGLRYCRNVTCDDIYVEDPFEIYVEAHSLGCSGEEYILNDTILFRVVPPVAGPTLIPNVFTPNADGKNDKFLLYGNGNICTDSIEIQIFDRWGNLVLETSDPYFEWDGTNNNGGEVSEGTYYVILKGIFGDVDITRNYPLTLLRDY